ncbi:cytochrome c-type biogenesis protein [Uliginosibacterium sediminicola]|uniref:Cytochrome c-type biogenesis protein n=1 Tax=Uliginosibacterium sediminicola TaxID=2024550 RepID=A0ABU9Z1L4_9RHOO
MAERRSCLRPLRRLLGALSLCLLAQIASAQSDPALEAHVNAISERLRCLVCQNQSIAESQADLANDLRRQVREMLAAGKSEDDVIAFMVERYGDFVLYDPPFKYTTLLLWGGPAALMLLALGGFAWTVRQRRAAAPQPQLTDAERERAQALLDNKDNT